MITDGKGEDEVMLRFAESVSKDMNSAPLMAAFLMREIMRMEAKEQVETE